MLSQQLSQPLLQLLPAQHKGSQDHSGSAPQIELAGNFAQMKLSDEVKLDKQPSFATDQSMTVNAAVIVNTASETALKLNDQVCMVLERLLKPKQGVKSMSGNDCTSVDSNLRLLYWTSPD